MTQEQYLQFADEFFNKCLEISKAKNTDYTGGGDDAFANFTSVESLHISTEAGFITRMNDKMMRIASFVKNGTLQVKDESVKDTLRDLANYACLFAGYLESKKPKDNYWLVCTAPIGTIKTGDQCKWELISGDRLRVSSEHGTAILPHSKCSTFFKSVPV